MIGMDPFDALFRLRRALDTQLASNWLSNATAGIGAFPPINLFQQGHDFVDIVQLPGVKPDALNIEAKETSLRLSGLSGSTTTLKRACIAASVSRAPLIA